MTSIRSNKENIVGFPTPLAGGEKHQQQQQQQPGIRHSTRKPLASSTINKKIDNASLTPMTTRVPFGGKDTNVKKAPVTLKKLPFGSANNNVSSPKKSVSAFNNGLTQTPSLKQKPAFTIQEDILSGITMPEPIQREQLQQPSKETEVESSLWPDIEYTPEPLTTTTRSLYDDDDLGLDLDFDFIKQSMRNKVLLRGEGDLDRPLVFRDDGDDGPAKTVGQKNLIRSSTSTRRIKQPPRMLSASQNNVPRYMTPTTSASNKRTAKPFGTNRSNATIFSECEVTTSELLDQLD